MAKKKQEAKEVEAFPVALAEFARSLPQGKVEIVDAFCKTMKAHGEIGRKPPEQWRALFEKFQTKPTGVAWKQWASQNRRK